MPGTALPQELLHHQSGEEFEYMKAKVKELEAFQWEALTNLKILRDDNAQLKKDIKKTKEEAEQTVLTELQKMDATVSDLKVWCQPVASTRPNISCTGRKAALPCDVRADASFSRSSVAAGDGDRDAGADGGAAGHVLHRPARGHGAGQSAAQARAPRRRGPCAWKVWRAQATRGE